MQFKFSKKKKKTPYYIHTRKIRIHKYLIHLLEKIRSNTNWILPKEGLTFVERETELAEAVSIWAGFGTKYRWFVVSDREHFERERGHRL